MTTKRTRPHFIAIGAPHTGINTIMQLLSAHPDLVKPIQSLQFFSSDAFEKKGLAWYESQFSYGESHMVTGECSPYYLSHSEVPARLVRHFPDTKLVVVLRHPLKRAIAHFEQWRQSPKEKQKAISFSTFLNSFPDAQNLGLYGQQLEAYFSYYSPLQIHVVLYEEFAENPLSVIQNLYRFLDLRADVIPLLLRQFAPLPDEPRHKSLFYRAKTGINFLYKKFLKKPPVPVTLPEYRFDTYLSVADQALLTKLYAGDARRLSRLLHRDMGVFWNVTELPPDLA